MTNTCLKRFKILKVQCVLFRASLRILIFSNNFDYNFHFLLTHNQPLPPPQNNNNNNIQMRSNKGKKIFNIAYIKSQVKNIKEYNFIQLYSIQSIQPTHIPFYTILRHNNLAYVLYNMNNLY